MERAGNTEPAIDVHGLRKSFGGRLVVDDFAIRVERGEIFGFLGPNGSGKTTTIRMLCGRLTPDAGEGRCLGFDLRTQAALIKREVGYMTQRFSLYIVVGVIQAGIILFAAWALFDVPMYGSAAVLMLGMMLFIAALLVLASPSPRVRATSCTPCR